MTLPWSLRMAWRDSRGSRRRLLLFLSSMVLGVAALVAINAFGENLEDAVDEQARTLLGADLSLESSRPFQPVTEAIIDSLGGEQARQIGFASMAYFPANGEARLASIRALDGRYPFYGQIETAPASASRHYRRGEGALVDGALLEELGVAVGDSVRVGRETYVVAGELLSTPRESAVQSLFSPRIYVPYARLDTTLLTRGSRAEYEVYFKFEDERDLEATVEALRPRLREQRVGFDTVGEIKENWNEGLTNLYRFLSLVGFVALLLGGVGVGSAVHVYVKQRVASVAVLRCLGARSWRTVRVYLVQAFVMGLVGAVLGCLLGLGVQLVVPRILADFLPVDVDFALSWRALGLGLGVGIGVTVLFALLPLSGVRRISPLHALRASAETTGAGRDPLRWVLYVLIAAGVTFFAVVQAGDPLVGLGYAGGVAVVFALLALTARAITWAARRFFPSGWPYVWRQGLANLYRPQNQTLILMLALGLGTFLIMTLYLVQRTLLAQVEVATDDGQPNLVLFDIQPDQLAGVTEIVEGQNLPILQRVPIVTMRLAEVNGASIDAMREDTTVDLSWAHRREYRSTYRSYLNDSEEVIAGAFDGTMPEAAEVLPGPDAQPVVPISVEQEVAGDLEVGLGDTLVWNVQGVKIPSVITSLREVDWRQFSTNFFVVFPEGALEEAPQFNVILTHTPDEATAARLQSRVVEQHPNVSAVDLSLVLSVFEQVFGRISFVLRFMAGFSVLTGLLVLMGAVLISRYQRMEESVLLKTLGASRRVVLRIMVIEYVFLGVFATLTGLLLSMLASGLLARLVFDAPFVLPFGPLALALVAVTGLTVGIGLLNSRGIYDRPPLAVLRAE